MQLRYIEWFRGSVACGRRFAAAGAGFATGSGQRGGALQPQGSKGVKVGSVVDGKYEIRRDSRRRRRRCGLRGVAPGFTHRRVALKIVSPEAPRSTMGELRARLVREARALATVRHPGIVDILDGGLTDDGHPYIVLEMPRESACTLEGLLTGRGRLSPRNAVAIGLQLASSLEAAHSAGVVHRDLKPSNVFVTRDRNGFEWVKLMDFGTARLSDPSGARLTGIGALIGTPQYMAPEQLLALDDVDERADVYALGVTLFECLTGKVPYEGNYQQVLLQAAGDGEAPSPRAAFPELDQNVARVIQRAIAKDRNDRFQTMGDFAQALEAAMPNAPRNTCLVGAPVAAASPVETTTLLSEADDVSQRRRAVRAPYVTPLRVVSAKGDFDARSEDISEGGLMFVSRDSFTAGETCEMRFALPIEGTVVSCTAQVRWVRAARPNDPAGPRAIGVEFVNASPELKASVTRYISLMGVETR